MSRLAVAVYSAAGCGGCDIALLEIHELILDLADAADIVFWPTAVDFKYADVEALADGSIDVCLFNGAIRTEENAEVAQLLRRKSKVLVAFGACAAFGGIPGLANFSTNDDLLGRVFATESTDGGDVRPETGHHDPDRTAVPALMPRVSHLASVVPVDAVVPGCAPERARVVEICQALLGGTLVPGLLGAGQKCVCDECSRPKRGTRVERFVRPHLATPEPDWCLLEQGIVCMGPATRSGCDGACPSVAMPCRGCYGLAGDSVDAGAAMVSLLGSVLGTEDEAEIVAAMAEVADPAGTFYCFSLPTSVLGGAVAKGGGAR